MPCFNSLYGLQTLFKDSLSNKLILGFSTTTSVCFESFRGIVSFNGSKFESLDVGMQTHISPSSPGSCYAQVCIPYNNKSLYGGWFGSVGSSTLFSPGLSYWNGSKWDSMEKKPFKFYENKNPIVSALYKDSSKLWIGGLFDTISNIPTKNLCYFDGFNYIPVNMTAKDNAGVKRVIKYKNQIYLSGLFQDVPSLSYSKIVRYANGDAQLVGNGIQGGFASVQDMCIYNDTLYVAGAFRQQDGNVGNHIMKWDGQQFYDAGFGSFHDWGAIYRLLIFKDRLYAFGTFTYAADQKAYGAAYYYKGKWVQCKDSTNITGIIGAEILNDQIYAAGSFQNINGNPDYEFFVRLKCPDFEGCPAEPSPPLQISVYPNPFREKITIEIPKIKPCNASIVNSLGQLLSSYNLSDEKTEVSTSHLPGGIYYVKVGNSSTQKVFKLIKTEL